MHTHNAMDVNDEVQPVDDSLDEIVSTGEPRIVSDTIDVEELSEELTEAAFTAIDKWQKNENSIG